MRTFVTSSLAFVALLALTGCEQKDTTPPAPPMVDPLQSPTPKKTISVSGSAEFNATVKIAGGAAEVTTTADPYTARWRVDVDLSPDASNELSVTATDAAGNVSQPTKVTVVQAASKPTTISLAFATPTPRAGELVGLVTRVIDQYGNEMPDAPVTFAVTPALAATFTIPSSMPAVTKDQGVLAGTRQFVAYDLSAVKANGYQFQVKATAGAVDVTQVLTVRPAAGASFSKLNFKPAGTTASVAAGTDVDYEYEVADLYGNVTQGPVSSFTNAPGAIVLDDGVSGNGKLTRLVTAGTYSVLFYIAGVGQKGSLLLNVDTAPAAFVDAVAAATLVSPQTPVDVFARVRDAFGNPIGCTMANAASMAFTAVGAKAPTQPLNGAATTCFNGAFRSSFTFTAEDIFTVTATWQPTGATAVSGNVFISVLAFDNTPPQVSITNVRVNGAACDPATRTPAGCDVVDGDLVEFNVVASDNTALAELAYSIFFESRQSLNTRTIFVAANTATTPPGGIYFRFRVSSSATETADLVASAVDRAGNRANSAAVTFYAQFGAFPVGNRTLTVVTSGGSTTRPQDIAFAQNGDLFILNRTGGGGTGTITRLVAGQTIPTIFANNFQGGFIANGTSAGQERFFVTDTNGGTVQLFNPAGGGLSTLADPNGNQAMGLSVLGVLPARGWVDVTTAALADQVRVTNGATTEIYEFSATATCTAGASCVTVAVGATGAQKATALAAAIGANAASAVNATALASQVLLAAKAPGEAGSTIALAKQPALSSISFSSGTLVEGHDSDLYVGSGGDPFVRRYLTTGGPYVGAANHGQFNVGFRQWGITARDIFGAAAGNALQDLMLYAPTDLGGNQNTLQGFEVRTTSTGGVVSTATASRFALNSTTVTPIVAFNTLWDTALAPNGCLLVSDEGNGNPSTGAIYAVDTRTGTAFTPAVERIARNLDGARGLAIAPNGDLLIAVNGSNAVMRLTPTPDPTDCF